MEKKCPAYLRKVLTVSSKDCSLKYYSLFKSETGKLQKVILPLYMVEVCLHLTEDFFPYQEKVDICNQLSVY